MGENFKWLLLWGLGIFWGRRRKGEGDEFREPSLDTMMTEFFGGSDTQVKWVMSDRSCLKGIEGLKKMGKSTRLPLIAIVIFLVANSVASGAEMEGKLESFLGEPTLEAQKIFRTGRWPNIIATLKGTLLATYGSESTESVGARRSEDGGKTWGEPIVIADPGFQGGGTTVDETSGDILVFIEEKHPPAPLMVYRSKDDGKTWLPQLDTVIKPDSKGNVPSMHMNEHGITLRHGKHRGRLLRAARWYGGGNELAEYPEMYTTAVYSDDGGLTWQTSEPFPEHGTGEAAIAELSDGRLYYNSRMHWSKRPKNRRRREAWSDDGGHTWKDWTIVDVLPDGQQGRCEGCMAGLLRLPIKGKDILLYSNVDTETFRRNRITVWGSFDGGKTWPVKRLLYGGPSAYSSLAAGRPGTPSEGWIYMHHERGEDHDDPNGLAHEFIPPQGSFVARFNLSWLLAGQATGDGPMPDRLSDQ